MPAETVRQSGGMAIVLVKPQLGENIGAAARIMLNFGLEDLRLVKPRDGWPNLKAAALASGAGRVLDNALVSADLPSALAGVQYVYATTARRRDINKPVLDPPAAMAEAGRRIERGQRVAVIFGPERAGLNNMDLASANAVIEVPVNARFKSINLAQCVALIAYERMRSAPAGGSDSGFVRMPADVTEKERFVDLLAEDLKQAGYFRPPEKSAGMRLNLRNLFMRMDLTAPEIRTLHGIRRALARRSSQCGEDPEPAAAESADGNNGKTADI